MIWKIFRLSYGMKNYQSHMGIRKIVTIRGMMRRLTRKYPKTYNYMKKAFLIGGFSCILLYFIPNSSLPMQK